MKNALLVAVLVVSSFAFAAPPPAKAPAAAPAKTAPAAAGATVSAADCDMHKAQAAMMKEMVGDKVKMEMVKLDNGTTGIMTTDAAHQAAVEKVMASMDTMSKSMMTDGKAKLCEECKGMVAAMKSGKVMSGMGHQGLIWTNTMLSSDAEMVKKMHSDVDAKLAAATPPAK